jgi:hypothetical protein
MLDAFLANTNQSVQTSAKYKKDTADAVLQALWYIRSSISKNDSELAS